MLNSIQQKFCGSNTIPLPHIAAMFNSPLLKKAEEKACVKKDESPDDGSTPSPPAKKLCTVYAKQLAKMPSGDQGLVKEQGSHYKICVLTKWVPTKESPFFYLKKASHYLDRNSLNQKKGF